MGILGADHRERIDWMGVATSGQRGLEDGQGLGASVPEDDLTRIRAADDVGGVEVREHNGQDVGLGVEDELGAFEKVKVPDAGDAVGFIDCHRVFIVRRN